MDKENERYWILGKGEEYIEPVKKLGRPIEKEYRFSYEEIRHRLKKDLKSVRETAKALPEKYRMDELVLCVRMLPEFIAKSYYPHSVTNVPGLKDVGSRSWRTTMPNKRDGGEKTVPSKLIFVRATENGLRSLEQRLDEPESELSGAWVEHVRRLDSLSFLRYDETVLGFTDDWTKGRVELVLHPFAQRSAESMEKLASILNDCGVSREKINPKSYSEGPTFVSLELERSALNQIARFNPLRTVHPLQFDMFPTVRSAGKLQGPNPPSASTKSLIKVGMFDGGVDAHNDLLRGFVTKCDEVATSPSQELELHGTAVAGILLYGELSGYSSKDTLPTPNVTVESFRALPPSNSKDLDLYESIDLIESVVPKRKDIRVYNISFGPRGAILDDHITRFTFALDKLANENDVLFNVAVGNDGDLPSPYNRVQAPSDIVNGLGIGAYTVNRRSKMTLRAEYSSVGTGREGCKVKPDVVAFGGCSCQPFHVVTEFGQKALTWGTSYATPLVSKNVAELLGRSNEMTPLLARCLMIHTASNPSNIRDTEMGYGMVQTSLEDVLRTSNKTSVTVLYQSSLLTGKYARLPISVPVVTDYNARVNITWTIALLSSVSTMNTDEYTRYGVEDTFYPNDSMFGFTKLLAGKRQTVFADLNKEPDRVAALLAEDWTRSALPKTDSGKLPTEADLRAQHLKWDTVVKNNVTKQLSSLHNPFLTLHAMNRNGADDEMLKYAVAVTVAIPKYRGDLYDDVRTQFTQLQPIRVRAVNEIMVSVS